MIIWIILKYNTNLSWGRQSETSAQRALHLSVLSINLLWFVFVIIISLNFSHVLGFLFKLSKSTLILYYYIIQYHIRLLFKYMLGYFHILKIIHIKAGLLKHRCVEPPRLTLFLENFDFAKMDRLNYTRLPYIHTLLIFKVILNISCSLTYI